MYDVWEKVVPSKAAEQRMLAAILTQTQSEQGKVIRMKQKPVWKKAAPLAACLAVVVALTAVFGNLAGWFGAHASPVTLDGGTLRFRRNLAIQGAMNFDLGSNGASRALTGEEITLLFGGAFGKSAVSAHGIFSKGSKYGPDKTLLHVEAMAENAADIHLSGIKIILAASSLGYISDTKIDIGLRTSEINGIDVSAGYWLTDKNSSGKRNIIYLASYETNGVTVYIEHGGSSENSNTLREEIAFAVDTLTRNGTPKLTAITNES